MYAITSLSDLVHYSTIGELEWCCRPLRIFRGFLVDFDNKSDMSELEKLFRNIGHKGVLGQLNDQTFYAVRHEPGKSLELPFAKQNFSALLNLAGKMPEEELGRIADELLKHGLACAVCSGDQAELMSEIIDKSIDENQSSFNDGLTPYSSAHEDGLSDALQYFALPSGITNISVIITIGSDSEHGSALDLFDSLFGGEVERVIPEAIIALEACETEMICECKDKFSWV